jgi:hypothetical protein
VVRQKSSGSYESIFQHQHRLSVNDLCHLIIDLFIGPYIFKRLLTVANYLNFLRNELPLLEERGGKAPIWERL